MMNKCEFGCGKEAKYQFKNGKWCCSKYYNQCPIERDKRSKRLKGKPSPLKGKKLSKSHIKSMSEVRKGKRAWNKGMVGVWSKKSIQQMIETKTYSLDDILKNHSLFSKLEELRYNPNDKKQIQGHCKNHKCKNSKEKNGWFTLTKKQIAYRYDSIDNGNGTSYFYCSDLCKIECPLFNLRSDPNIKKQKYYTQEEYNTWRNEVLIRADYLCEYCGEKATHTHHSRPQKLEPGFALDPDFGIACCEKHHFQYGHKTGTECSTGNLAKKECV